MNMKSDIQLNLFSDDEFEKDLLFLNKNISILGTFGLSPYKLMKRLTEMGADAKANFKVSRNVHYVLVGNNPPQDQMEYLQTIEFNGYYPKVLYQEDLDKIFSGQISGYRTEPNIQKKIHLTYQHYLRYKFNFSEKQNSLYAKELYVANDTLCSTEELYRILGEKGAYANSVIDDATDIILISDATMNHLRDGVSDDVIKYIEKTYNESHAQSYRYILMSESELLNELK